MKPTVADSRTPNRLILRGPAGDLPAVTAEAAGSSPVVPAIHSKAVNEWCFHSSLPTISPTPSLDGLPLESHRVKELVLSGDHLVEVFVRVQIERGLNTRMTQDALHRLRVLLCLIHQPVRQAVSKVV